MVHSDKTQTLATLTKNGNHHPDKCCQSWRAIALSLPHEVNLPGYPEGGQLWSRSALTSNQPGRRIRNGKSSSSRNHSSSLHHSSNTHTGTARCNHHSALSLVFYSTHLFSLVPSHLELQSLACSSQKVLLQYELKNTINKSAGGETTE